VARTHFRGLVRKRFMPVITTPAPPDGGSGRSGILTADPIAAATARHIDDAHSHGVGGGQGGTQAHRDGVGHGRGHAHGHGHAAGAPSKEARVHIPFTWVEREGAHHHHRALPSPHKGDDIVWHASGGNAVTEGEKAGRYISAAPGSNVGLALLRLEHLAAALPRPPKPSRVSGEPDGTAAAETDVDDALAAGGVGVADDDDCTKAPTVAAYEALHARVREAARTLGRWTVHTTAHSAGHPDKPAALHLHPVLPVWWRHVSHAGLDEVPVVVTPGA